MVSLGFVRIGRRMFKSHSVDSGQPSEGAMDKMKKILRSPVTRRKNSFSNKYFGVPLEEVLRRENSHIPALVVKSVNYICSKGLNQEGVFRINGNSRVVERLRSAFDRSGGAQFEDDVDVASVAGLLKLYLRELPDGIVNPSATKQFVHVQSELAQDEEAFLPRLRALLLALPGSNRLLLKYLCCFLSLLSKHEQQNKMNATGLGIVFGPNIFRCQEGLGGLKEQGITNQITYQLISNYQTLLGEDKANDPKAEEEIINMIKEFSTESKVPPPRPPPPQFHPRSESSPTLSSRFLSPTNSADSASSRSFSPIDLPKKSEYSGSTSPPFCPAAQLPVPSPRKPIIPPKPVFIKQKFVYHADLTPTQSGDVTPRTPRNGHVNSVSDEEILDTQRSVTPSVLETDRSEASVAVFPEQNECVKHVISSVIHDHIFGDHHDDAFAMEDVALSNVDTPVPAPRKPKVASPELEKNMSVLQKIEHFEMGNSLKVGESPVFYSPKGLEFSKGNNNNSPRLEVKKTDQAWRDEGEVNRKKQLITDPICDTQEDSRPFAKPRIGRSAPPQDSEETGFSPDSGTSTMTLRETGLSSDDSGFATVQRTADGPLLAFKRAPGPRNRRNPSKHSLRLSGTADPSYQSHNYQESADDIDPSEADNLRLNDEDLNHNETKLGQLVSGSRPDGSRPGLSLSGSRSDDNQSYVPPLDLSILHEHGDGNEPILAETGQSLSFQKSYPDAQYSEDAVLSHSARHLKQQTLSLDETEPQPSPNSPMYPNREPEHVQESRQLTKKIQACKKKIKSFEDDFEHRYGHRPSQADKASRPEMKKCIQELARARKELKKSKENIGTQNVKTTLVVEENTTPLTTSPLRIESPLSETEQTLMSLLERLAEKRRLAERPEELHLMTAQQILDEKLSVQKSLLQYENHYGRPSSRQEKETMRPLYDRYRAIKRLVAIATDGSREGSDLLQSVPEDSPMEFSPTSQQPIRIPTASEGESNVEQEQFLVTRDPNLLKDALTLRREQSRSDSDPEIVQFSPEETLHYMSIPQLHEELVQSRQEKKRLRRLLKEFEDNFYLNTSRKVTKVDRAPMDAEYNQYKQIKARLKLLDALISRREAN